MLTTTASAGGAGFQNLNPTINQIADAQGVRPGSPEWLAAGPAAYSGQTGSHGSYGWRHHHRVDRDFIRAAIANYGHRRTYYDSAPTRQFGYEAGGRPTGWMPESPGDQPDGSWITPDGVRITGPEVEHFWLDPLWAIVDSLPVDIDSPLGSLPSDRVARVLATFQVASLIGQIRYTPTSVYPWGYGDRANARIIDTIVQAAQRGCIHQRDVPSALEFIESVALPFYEKAPGISTTTRGEQRPGKVRVMTYNGLMWLLPTFYDAWQAWPEGSTRARLEAVVRRWSRWCLDLESAAPGRGFALTAFHAPTDGFVRSGPPVDTLEGLVTEADMEFGLINWERWGYRAAAVAAEILDSDSLRAAVTGIRERHTASTRWLIGVNRQLV